MSQLDHLPELATRRFWIEAVERAAKTGAQTARATIGVDQLDVLSSDWVGIVLVRIAGTRTSTANFVMTRPERALSARMTPQRSHDHRICPISRCHQRRGPVAPASPRTSTR